MSVPMTITLTFEAGIEDYEDAMHDINSIIAILENVTMMTGNEFEWIGKITAKVEEIL